MLQRLVMFSYEIYGISLHSHIALAYPPSAAGSAPPDVTIERAPGTSLRHLLNGTTPQVAGWCEHAHLANGSIYLRCPEVAEFVLSADGSHILCCSSPAAAPESWQTYLLGQVLSFALVTKGIEPLHATVVVVDGEAFGLLGESGQGKSTLAASFLQQGHRLLTDDLLVLRDCKNIIRAYPGPPRIKLFRRQAEDFLGALAAGVPMNQFTTKLVIPLAPNQLEASSVPLRALYVLVSPKLRMKATQETRISRLRPRHAVIELLKHTFNRILVNPERLLRQFENAARLASRVPVRKLAYPRDLGHVPDLREAILTDLARLRPCRS